MKTNVILISLAFFLMAFGTQAAPSETLNGLEVSRSSANDRTDDGAHSFGVDAKQGGQEWTGALDNLMWKLGGKLGWLLSESMLEEQRKGFKEWSQQINLDPGPADSWNQPLQEPFHPEALIKKDCHLSLPSGNQAASLETLDGLEVSTHRHCDQSADGVQLFGVSVKQGGQEWLVMQWYSDFFTLMGKLGPEAENWLQQVFLHASSAESWEGPLQEFFHPEALTAICSIDSLLRFAKTALYKLGESYEEGLKYCHQNKRCKTAKDRFEKLKQRITEKMDSLGGNFLMPSLLATLGLSIDFLRLLGLQ
jgi:hypothetical protein